MAFDLEGLKDILVCPKSKSKLVMEGQSLTCVDPDCRLRYEIRDNIPIMLIEEATELSPEDWGAIMQKRGRDPVSGKSGDEPDTPDGDETGNSADE